MLLRNLYSVGHDKVVDITINGDTITEVSDKNIANKEQLQLAFDDAIVFPGLINSHDHLDFNLFPQLGNRIYNNYVSWGNDIHKVNAGTIEKVLSVPKELRTLWGVYKNLLNGVTTVVNHGELLDVTDDLINVHQYCHVIHSIRTEEKWKLKLTKPFIEKWPFVVHVGEGTDVSSETEIDELIKWNLFRRKLIGIHGVAMTEKQATKFKALVWCPVSNIFLIGRTALVTQLKRHTKMLFGTDSTLSAGWNIWEHLQTARGTHKVTDRELYEMVTTTPAEVWKLGNKGKFEAGTDADIVIARRSDNFKGLAALYATQPADILLVLRSGKIKLFDSELYEDIKGSGIDISEYSKVKLANSLKYVYGDLPKLIQEIRAYYPEAKLPVQ